MRTNLTVEDLGDLLDRPPIAVLATLRTDGTVLLSPVYHEWRDGGFNIWVRAAECQGPALDAGLAWVIASLPPWLCPKITEGCPAPPCGRWRR
jgi:hypothetical protein